MEHKSTFQINWTNNKLSYKETLTISEKPIDDTTIIPLAQSLTDHCVNQAIKDNLKDDQSISCKKGCSSCCSQLVPITHTEVSYLHMLIEQLAPEHKQRIISRFEGAKTRLIKNDLWDAITSPQLLTESATTQLKTKYAALNIQCPFLENNSCSIHPYRPLVCREFLVTSPADLCQPTIDKQTRDEQTKEKIKCLPVLPVSQALSALLLEESGYISIWIPLIMVPFWETQYKTSKSRKTEREWIELLLKKAEVLKEI